MENFFLWAKRRGAVCTAHSRLSSTRRNASQSANRVVRAFLDRDRNGLLVFFVCVVLFHAAAFFYLLA